MLDSLGSTLTRTTVSSFFTRYGKDPHRDQLMVDEAFTCLEEELGGPDSEKKRLDADDGMPGTSVSATPILSAGARGQELRLDLADLDFSGSTAHRRYGRGRTRGNAASVHHRIKPNPFAGRHCRRRRDRERVLRPQLGC